MKGLVTVVQMKPVVNMFSEKKFLSRLVYDRYLPELRKMCNNKMLMLFWYNDITEMPIGGYPRLSDAIGFVEQIHEYHTAKIKFVDCPKANVLLGTLGIPDVDASYKNISKAFNEKYDIKLLATIFTDESNNINKIENVHGYMVSMKDKEITSMDEEFWKR